MSLLPDYLATTVMSVVGILAFTSELELRGAGMAFTMITCVAMLVSYLTRLFGGSNRWLEAGPWLGAALGMIGWFLPMTIAGVVSGDDVPGQMMVGVRVAWLLVLRCFALWSDGDLVFQAVPVMALFGIAAATSQEISLVLLFIVFVLCVIFLLSRQHVRALAQMGGSVPWQTLAPAGTGYALLTTVAVFLVAVLATPALQVGMTAMVAPIVRANIGKGAAGGTSSDPNADTVLEIGVGGHSSTNVKVLQYDSREPLYLRERAFGAFNGIGWTGTGTRALTAVRYPDRLTDPYDLTEQMDSVVLDRERQLTYTVEILSGLHNFVYAAGEPVTVKTSAAFLQFAPTVCIWPREPFRPGDSYQATSSLPPNGAGELRRASAPRAMDREQRMVYYQMPPTRSPELRGLALRVAGSLRTDYDRVEALRNYVSETCMYSLNEPPYEGEQDRVAEFLFVRKKGYCDSFASALAILCRELDIPARVVRGYAPGEYDSKTNRWVVREKHYHLWTEVFFSGIGWVPFDAVDGAREVDAAQVGAAVSVETQSFWRSPWPPVIIDGLALAVVAYIAASWWRSRRTGPGNGFHDRREVVTMYAQFVRSLRRVGCEARRPEQTPREYLAGIEASLPASEAALAKRLTAEVDAALFSRSLADETLAALRARLTEWLQAVKGLPR